MVAKLNHCDRYWPPKSNTDYLEKSLWVPVGLQVTGTKETNQTHVV